MLWCRSMFCKTIYILEVYIMYHVLQKVWINKSIHISTNCQTGDWPLTLLTEKNMAQHLTGTSWLFFASLSCLPAHIMFTNSTQNTSAEMDCSLSSRKTVKAVCHLLFISSIMAVVIVTVCVYTVKKSYIHLQPLNRFVSTSKCRLSCLC